MSLCLFYQNDIFNKTIDKIDEHSTIQVYTGSCGVETL